YLYKSMLFIFFFLYIFVLFFFFFFSSRRRHTRCLSDWSSDVCSSDLELFDETEVAAARGGMDLAVDVRLAHPARDELGELRAVRSEERRVGKECRSRWSP